MNIITQEDRDKALARRRHDFFTGLAHAHALNDEPPTQDRVDRIHQAYSRAMSEIDPRMKPNTMAILWALNVYGQLRWQELIAHSGASYNLARASINTLHRKSGFIEGGRGSNSNTAYYRLSEAGAEYLAKIQARGEEILRLSAQEGGCTQGKGEAESEASTESMSTEKPRKRSSRFAVK